MQYLSDEWLAAADSALSTAWESVEDRGDADTTIAYEVTGAPQGKVAYTLTFGPSGAGVSPGAPEGEPDATMALDYDTAAEVAKGELAAQVAFMQGRLKLGGDVTLLIERADRLGAVGHALADLNADTEF